MSVSDPDRDQVAGERAAAFVERMRGMQSRFSSLFALALMLGLGGGALTWYYAHLWRTRSAAVAGLERKSEVRSEDAPLPEIGPIRAPAPLIDPPPAAAAPSTRSPADESTPALPLPEHVPPASDPASIPMEEVANPQFSPETPAHRVLDRQLGGAAFAPGSNTNDPTPVTRPREAGKSLGSDALGTLLQTTDTVSVQARRLPSQRLLLPKGAFIDCTLETAIDSTLPGLTTCITASDVFGANGEVVLLERGTKLVGEVRGQVRQGMARVFVLWTEARTPDGVVVPLDSPGTDELGRAGLPGTVNRHFWQRFGAALLISVVDAGIQAGVQATNRGGGTLVVNPEGADSVLTGVLSSTVDIPPTIVKRQGDRIQVLVARDLDFRSVYALRLSPAKLPR